jgi:type IV pilus assembly protein PilA
MTVAVRYPKRVTNLHSIWVFEIVLVITLIGILAALAIGEYARTIKITTTVGALQMSWPVKSEIYRFHALHGVWPNTNDLTELSGLVAEEPSISRIIVNDGSYDVVFSTEYAHLAAKVLSFRRVEFENVPGATTMWICGFRVIPPGMTTNAKNITTISPEYLPETCK